MNRDLSICPHCGKDFVFPVEWEEVSHIDWKVVLRCANCEHLEVGVFDQATVDRFDHCLDITTEVVVRDMFELQRANLTVEADRFAAALGADQILPEDF